MPAICAWTLAGLLSSTLTEEGRNRSYIWAADVVEGSEAGYCALAVHDVCYKGPPRGHKPQGGLPSNEYAAACSIGSVSEALQTVSS